MHSLEALTLELVSIPSVSGEEGALADRVQAHFSGIAGETSRTGHNVIHLGPRHSGRPLIVLAGHLDTVPAQENERPYVRDGRLHGLGSSDMKAGLAVMMAVAEEIDSESSRFDLAYVFYACEEVELERNGLRKLWSEFEWLTTADAAIILEGTDCVAELGCQGTLHAEFTSPGRAAHSARPWLGENAIYRALPTLQKLAEITPRPVELGGVTYKETLQVTRAHAGGGRNVVPASFTFNVNFRYAPDRTPEEAESHVRKLAPPEFEVVVVDVAPPAPPRSDHPLIAEFLREFDLERRAKQAWTDVAQFAERGVAAFNFGPGIPELAHRKDEYVPLANIERAREILLGFLGGPGASPGGGARP